MRNILLLLAGIILLAMGLGAIYLWKGREISVYIDRFGTADEHSTAIQFIRYEGSGTGGVLYANNLQLTLNDAVPGVASPAVGSTKDGKLGLAAGGKGFAFGPVTKESDDPVISLTAAPEPGDKAVVGSSHSRVSWPIFFSMNFMTGCAPSWKRHTYQRLSWEKADGKALKMRWRYEQQFDGRNGWTSLTMTGAGATGLFEIQITP